VALALTPLLVRLGFRVVVLDDRPGLDTMEANTDADERRVVDYARIVEHVPAGPDSYVCIMTHGHRHDEEVLQQLLQIPLGYLGMMGSAPKVETIRRRLLARGASREALDAERHDRRQPVPRVDHRAEADGPSQEGGAARRGQVPAREVALDRLLEGATPAGRTPSGWTGGGGGRGLPELGGGGPEAILSGNPHPLLVIPLRW